MDLIPLQVENGDGGLREISISEQAAALLDLRVSPVLRAPAQVNVKLFGKIDYDERTIVTTTARMSGRLDRLYADFTGTTVSKGDAIAEIYSPELYVAQQELIQAVQSVSSSSSPAVRSLRLNLLAAAREKLHLLELTDQQIAAIETQRKPSNQITLTAQQDGIIVKLNAKQGQYLKTGDPLFGIAKLSSVWLKMEAYESDLPWLRYAQKVSFTVEAIPGKTFYGRIAFIDPQLDPKRRIVKSGSTSTIKTFCSNLACLPTHPPKQTLPCTDECSVLTSQASGSARCTLKLSKMALENVTSAAWPWCPLRNSASSPQSKPRKTPYSFPHPPCSALANVPSSTFASQKKQNPSSKAEKLC